MSKYELRNTIRLFPYYIADHNNRKYETEHIEPMLVLRGE